MPVDAKIYSGDCRKILPCIPNDSVNLVYCDPPFGIGKDRTYVRLKTDTDPTGDRTGFGAKRYRTKEVSTQSYADAFEDYSKFIRPRLKSLYRVLAPNGSLFLHVDYRNSHHCRLILDEIFGPENFKNEIIWAWDYGAKPKNRWPAKHNNIFWYTKNPKNYTFNRDAIDRIPYMAPSLVGEKKAKLGKVPTSCWWGTIVPTNGKERTGYPTQKPLWLLKRIVSVHSNKGDTVLDAFAGSGTTGEAAGMLGRNFILMDSNPIAVTLAAKRLKRFKPTLV